MTESGIFEGDPIQVYYGSTIDTFYYTKMGFNELEFCAI